MIGVTLDHSRKKALLLDMTNYVDQMKEDFLEKLEKETKDWSGKFFSVDKNSKRLCTEKSDTFHSFVMKIMFLCKRGQPDVELSIIFLSARTSKSAEHDYNKLIRLLSFIVTNRNDAIYAMC